MSTKPKPEHTIRTGVWYASVRHPDDIPILYRTNVTAIASKPKARAMALNVFDQLGVVRNSVRSGDPIVVGQILDPRGGGRMATFFVAWWLDTADL